MQNLKQNQFYLKYMLRHVLRFSYCSGCLFLCGPLCECAAELDPIYCCLQHVYFKHLFNFYCYYFNNVGKIWTGCHVVYKICLAAVIIFGLRFAFSTHISRDKRTVLNAMITKTVRTGCTDAIDYYKVISEWRRAKQWRIYQFLNNMAYKTVTSTCMRDCVMKINFM